jgi:Na+/H+ antiporter NhaD/arsenite permease-like protein
MVNQLEFQQILAAAVFLAVYAAFATRLIHRALAALAGVVVLSFWAGPGPLVSAVVPEALLVTAGLMVVAGAIKRSGLAAWLALTAAKVGRGRPIPILVLTSLVSFLLGALVGPGAALLVAPVALLLAVELDVDSLPFLLGLSWSALWGSAVLWTSQPASLWIVSALGLAPGSWLTTVAPLVTAAWVATLGAEVLLFRRRLRVTNERRARVLEFDSARSLGDKGLVIRALTVSLLVAAGLVAVALGLPVAPSVIALAGATVLLIGEGRNGVDRALADLDLGLLVFYGGLFGVVAFLGASGLPSAVAGWVTPSGPALLAAAAVLSAFVDHGAVLGALVPVLASWGAAGAGSLWVYAVLGTTLGAGITVWGSVTGAAALSLAGQGKHTPPVGQYTLYSLVLGAISFVVVAGLGFVILR